MTKTLWYLNESILAWRVMGCRDMSDQQKRKWRVASFPVDSWGSRRVCATLYFFLLDGCCERRSGRSSAFRCFKARMVVSVIADASPLMSFYIITLLLAWWGLFLQLFGDSQLQRFIGIPPKMVQPSILQFYYKSAKRLQLLRELGARIHAIQISGAYWQWFASVKKIDWKNVP